MDGIGRSSSYKEVEGEEGQSVNEDHKPLSAACPKKVGRPLWMAAFVKDIILGKNNKLRSIRTT